MTDVLIVLDLNKRCEVVALKKIDVTLNRHTTETRVAYDNSTTWYAINTGYINSTKETSSDDYSIYNTICTRSIILNSIIAISRTVFKL